MNITNYNLEHNIKYIFSAPTSIKFLSNSL